jgi:hypothetical protein
LIQAVLLGLIFANRQLLAGSIVDFTSAATQGRIGPFVVATRTRSITLGLNAWTGFDSMFATARTRNVSAAFRDDFNMRFQIFKSDAMFLIARSVVVVFIFFSTFFSILFRFFAFFAFFGFSIFFDLFPFFSIAFDFFDFFRLFRDFSCCCCGPAR